MIFEINQSLLLLYIGAQNKILNIFDFDLRVDFAWHNTIFDYAPWPNFVVLNFELNFDINWHIQFLELKFIEMFAKLCLP